MISVVIPVYRDAVNALELADVLPRQRLPENCSLEIILVDDGSGDGTADVLKGHESGALCVVALSKNSGRAQARNAGAEAAHGEFLCFIDCDCRPVGVDFLMTHLQALRRGCVASCGPVTGDGRGFWVRYQADASIRRERQYTHGIVYSGSSQNCAVRNETFQRVGGFDARYREYGFEDRDLFLRLSRLGKVSWSRDAVVRHLDALTLPAVLTKMRNAGGESAIRFSRDHLGAYRALGYAAIDARLHGGLRIMCALFGPLLNTAPVVERLLGYPWIPYTIRKIIVKLFGALAFSCGSAHSGLSIARDETRDT